MIGTITKTSSRLLRPFSEIGRVLKYDDTKPTEFWSSIFEMGFGLVMIFNQNLFNSSLAYIRISGTHEWIWGCVLLLIGLLRIRGVRTNSEAVRRFACFLGSTFWLLWFMFVILTPVFGAIHVISFIYTFKSWWIFYRLALNHDES